MRIPYTKRSYEEIRKELIKQIPNYTDKWTDFNLSDPGVLILDALAAIADLINYSIDRSLAEVYLATATRRSSLLKIASLVGYRPRRPSPALTTVRFFLDSPHDYDIPIGMFTTITGNNLLFITLQNAVLAAGGTEVVVPVAQLEVNTVEVVSDGSPNQKILLGPDQEISGDFTLEILGYDLKFESTLVTVDGEPWKRVDSFIDDTGNVYIEETRDEGLYVVFGDGVFGKIPPKGSVIKVQFYKTAGSSGNVSSTSIAGTVMLYDAVGALVTLRYQALENANGGAEAESFEELKRNIPAFVRFSDVLTTRESWILAIESIPGVLKANAWGEEQENPPNPEMFNKVRFTFIPETPEWSLPNSALVALVTGHLEKRKQITLKIEYVETQFVEFDVRVLVKVNPYYSATTVIENIRSTINSMFSWNNVSYEQEIHHSDIVGAVENVEGVESCFVSLRCPSKGVSAYSVTDLSFGLYEIPKLNYLEVTLQ